MESPPYIDLGADCQFIQTEIGVLMDRATAGDKENVQVPAPTPMAPAPEMSAPIDRASRNVVVWFREDVSLWKLGVALEVDQQEHIYDTLGLTADRPPAASEKLVLDLQPLALKVVHLSSLRDFCKFFNTAYQHIPQVTGTPETSATTRSPQEYETIVKTTVALAAARANAAAYESWNEASSGDAWLRWARANLHRFKDLYVTDTFFDGLRAQLHPANAYSTGASASVSATRAPVKRAYTEQDIQMLQVPLDAGWRREVSIRKTQGDTSNPRSKKGDVYYRPPACLPGAKKLRSTVDVGKWMAEHPDCGLELNVNFSFNDNVRTGHRNENVHIAGAHGVSAHKS